MIKIFEEMPLEQRINYVFRDAVGIGHRFPEIDTRISRCMQYEISTFDTESFYVKVIRDLEMNEIIKVEPVEQAHFII